MRSLTALVLALTLESSSAQAISGLNSITAIPQSPTSWKEYMADTVGNQDGEASYTELKSYSALLSKARHEKKRLFFPAIACVRGNLDEPRQSRMELIPNTTALYSSLGKAIRARNYLGGHIVELNYRGMPKRLYFVEEDDQIHQHLDIKSADLPEREIRARQFGQPNASVLDAYHDGWCTHILKKE